MAKGTDYRVESKEELRRIGKTGEIEVFYRIRATSKGGTFFSVDVPEVELGRADEALTARAKQLDSI